MLYISRASSFRPRCWSQGRQISVPDRGCRCRSHYSCNSCEAVSSRGCTRGWGNDVQHIQPRWILGLEIVSTCLDVISKAGYNVTFKTAFLTFLWLQISIWRPSSLQRWYYSAHGKNSHECETQPKCWFSKPASSVSFVFGWAVQGLQPADLKLQVHGRGTKDDHVVSGENVCQVQGRNNSHCSSWWSFFLTSEYWSRNNGIILFKEFWNFQ